MGLLLAVLPLVYGIFQPMMEHVTATVLSSERPKMVYGNEIEQKKRGIFFVLTTYGVQY